MMRIRDILRRFRRSEDGGATIEFAILFPAFLAIMISSFESGLMMIRNVMLERGVDLAVRELRLGTPVPPTFDELKDTICDNALIIGDCLDRIQLELQPISTTTFAVPSTNAPCIDVTDTINPIDDTTFIGGSNNELMLVRVCSLHRPMFPTTTLGMQMPVDAHGNYALVVTSAFVNEPTR